MIPVGTRVKITVSCPMRRWDKGETGVLMTNDFDKYHYKVRLDAPVPPSTVGFLGEIKVSRTYYFYEDELEAING